MAISASKWPNRHPLFSAKGPQSSQLRRRKHVLARRFNLPVDLIGGSLVFSHRRCSKANCWCVDGVGHPLWTLTYRVDGKKYVDNIPKEMVESVRALVEQGQAYHQALKELGAINAQLLKLGQQQRKAKKKARSSPSRKPRKRSK